MYVSGLGMLGTNQPNSILFADHITFNNEYMKLAHTRYGMTNKKKSLIPTTIPVCFPTQQPLF